MTLVLLYPGATLEVKPVTTGHRLALRYELFQTTTRPRPTLVCQAPFAEMMQPLLREWEEGAASGYAVPEKIVALLEHVPEDPYEHCLSLDKLKDNDLALVTILQALAEQNGFRIGLAILNHFAEGSEEADAESDDDSTFHDSSDDSASSDAPGAEFRRASTTVLEKLVDLKGNSISDRLDFNSEEIAPLDILDIVESGDPEEEGSYVCAYLSHLI